VDDAEPYDFGYDSLSEIGAFYHASPHRFSVGDVLEPQPPAKRNFACSEARVYLTDAPAPHYCLAVVAKNDGWFIYRVDPIGPVRAGLAEDLICDAARVVACLGPASSFQGNSGVTMSSRYRSSGTQVGGDPGPRRIALAERALGATVTFQGAGDEKRRKGRIVFADYDTLNVLIETRNTTRLVSLKDCTVLTLRDTSLPVLHGARLDVWQHGEGWYGVGIADVRVADTWLEAPVAAAA